MRCNNCGKTVPNTTINCPYCSKQIDPNQVYVDKSLLEEPTTPNNPKDKIIEFSKKKENRSIVLGFAGLALLLVVLVFVGIAKLFSGGPKVDDALINKYFTDTYDHIMETYVSNLGNSGKYSLTASINENQVHYEGEYNLKLIERYFDISGAKKPTGATGDIIISDEDNFEFLTFLDNNKLHIDSKDFYKQELIYELPDEQGFLSASKLNVKNMANSLYDVFTYLHKEISPTIDSKSQTIQIGDNKIKGVYKVSWELDKNTKLEIIKEGFKTIEDDAAFLNEYSKMTGKSKEEIIKIFEAYKSTLTYRVKNGKADPSYFNVYADKKKVHRLEVIYVTDSDKYNIQLTMGNNTDYIVVKKNDKDYIDFKITKNEKELTNGVHKTLSFIYKDKNNNVTGDLVLDTNNRPNIKQKKSSSEAINVFDLSQEDQNTVKNDANSLLGYGLYDKLIDYVKPICSPELSCTCDDETEMCTCNKGSTFVTCKKSQIENKE